MAKYIDKAALVAEIEKYYNECLKRATIIDSDYWNAKADAYRNVLVIVDDTLEVKEADLDFEQKLYEAFGQVNLEYDNQLKMQEVTERNKFWEDFMEYITENAVGDKLALIQTVHYNDHNWSEGYVKVQKRINEKQELLLDFTTSKGDKRTATWQPSDNFACWQTCGMTGDDYSGFLLMPTYKDDEYFCIYYQC